MAEASPVIALLGFSDNIGGWRDDHLKIFGREYGSHGDSCYRTIFPDRALICPHELPGDHIRSRST